MPAESVTDSRRSSSVSHGGSSVRSDATWLTQKGTHNMGKGQMLFTGPGGVRDYKAHVVTDYHMVGIGTMSREGTSDLRYIWRGAPGSPHPVSRGKWAGEVGWLIPPFVDWKNITSGKQITMGDFRRAQEDKYTHRFQEPWYPAPNHPDYPKMFPHTNYYRTHTANPYVPHQHHHVRRPHTVASYQPEHHGSFPSISDGSSRPVSAHHSVISGSDQSVVRSHSKPHSLSNSGYESPSSMHSLRSGYSSSDRQTGSQSQHASSRRGSGVSTNSRSSRKRFGVAPSATQVTDYSNASHRSSPSNPDY
ncbi:uncharacterized protein LOC110980230 [Acanthaster planci]|uniref:Uncharacterized protein LOC110980230 n=1 Tax=Acanthaster planci TaxID=133434 RepID=A0A8B7YH13_ACAPL|nr:uncharacterized protein LOC110980230 [Acanthaster planci]XP_022092533.1 uncharacterized protein LOC110980230 [Acanthaster planci]